MWNAYQDRRAEIRLAATIGYQIEPKPLCDAARPLVAWGLELDRIAVAEETRRRRP